MAGELVEDELVSLEEALVDCARYGELDEVLEILNSTDPIVDINYQDSSGNTALHVAAANSHVEVVKLLLERGAVMRNNGSGNTPLHWAVQLGQVEAVRLLLALPSADVSAKNTFGKSALSMVMDGNTSEEMSELIVKHRSVVFEDSAAVSAAGADATTGGEEEGSDGSDEDEGEEGGDDEEADADVAAKALTDL